MIQTIRNAWKVQELRNKLLFTIFALLIFRVGAAIPVPFIDSNTLQAYMEAQSASIFGLLNVMSGDAFAYGTVFALSIQPYINSSIIIQLLTIAIPALERLAREGGEEGKKKIAAITRYVTVAIALIQAFGYYTLIRSAGVISAEGVWPAIVIIAAFTAGSAFVMWLGEQITEFGVGNGISIILFAGIVARGPGMVSSMINGVTNWANGTSGESALTLHPAFIPLIIVGILLLVIFIVFITNAERRIPVQYAKRVVGRKMYGGQSTFIPIKVNGSGVLPLIFAFALLSFPTMIFSFFPDWSFTAWWTKYMTAEGGHWVGNVVYLFFLTLFIFLFAFFYSQIQFNPAEVSKNIQQNGGFVPGIRPGKETADFLARTVRRITFWGAVFLAIMALLPSTVFQIINSGATDLLNAFSATGMLIVVSVALEFNKALENQIMMRHYKGFLK